METKMLKAILPSGATALRPWLYVTAGEYQELADEYAGVCLGCGELDYEGHEPDARRRKCHSCEENRVYGVEEALMMGRVEIVVESEDEPEMVTVESMPDHHRASHRAAGNWGVYPHNGAVRERVSREDAEAIVSADADSYARIVDEGVSS